MATIMRRVLLTIGAIAAFAVSMNMFAGYPRYGTQIVTVVVIAVLVAVAVVVLWRDERQALGEGDDPDE